MPSYSNVRERESRVAGSFFLILGVIVLCIAIGLMSYSGQSLVTFGNMVGLIVVGIILFVFSLIALLAQDSELYCRWYWLLIIFLVIAAILFFMTIGAHGSRVTIIDRATGMYIGPYSSQTNTVLFNPVTQRAEYFPADAHFTFASTNGQQITCYYFTANQNEALYHTYGSAAGLEQQVKKTVISIFREVESSTTYGLSWADLCSCVEEELRDVPDLPFVNKIIITPEDITFSSIIAQ